MAIVKTDSIKEAIKTDFVYKKMADYQKAKENHGKKAIDVAEPPGEKFTKVRVDTKLTVWEDNNGGTIAGKSCDFLNKYIGEVSFYVEAAHSAASYTVFINEGHASYPKRTMARNGLNRLLNSAFKADSEGTGAQLVKYLNFNLSRYSPPKDDELDNNNSVQSSAGGEAPAEPFHPTPVNFDFLLRS